MNVCSRSCSVAAREIRANAATEKNASAKIVLILLGPRLCAIASASTSDGNAMSTSSRRMMIGSRRPPQYAASAPRLPPITSPMRFTANAISSDA